MENIRVVSTKIAFFLARNVAKNWFGYSRYLNLPNAPSDGKLCLLAKQRNTSNNTNKSFVIMYT